MFPSAKSAVLPPDNAVYQTGAVKIGEVAYRPLRSGWWGRCGRHALKVWRWVGGRRFT